jgi:hypothetical protein
MADDTGSPLGDADPCGYFTGELAACQRLQLGG